jgi:hypothetical protein
MSTPTNITILSGLKETYIDMNGEIYMKKSLMKRCVFIITILFCLSAIAGIVFATPGLMATLPDKGASFGCVTCHVSANGGKALNDFGTDFKKYNTYNNQLAQLDSDKDGFTNAQEFAANPVTNPGDSKSFPKQSAVSSKGKKHNTWGRIKTQ